MTQRPGGGARGGAPHANEPRGACPRTCPGGRGARARAGLGGAGWAGRAGPAAGGPIPAGRGGGAHEY